MNWPDGVTKKSDGLYTDGQKIQKWSAKLKFGLMLTVDQIIKNSDKIAETTE